MHTHTLKPTSSLRAGPSVVAFTFTWVRMLLTGEELWSSKLQGGKDPNYKRNSRRQQNEAVKCAAPHSPPFQVGIVAVRSED